MSSRFILGITGPTGSGKTTVASKVAEVIDSTVNIDVDYVKHFIVNGFVYDDTPEGEKQWGLLGDNIGYMVNNYSRFGYNVIINGYLSESAWLNIENFVTLDHKLILLPALETVIQRDAGRIEDIKMGEAAVRRHHNDFSNNKFYKDFTRLDTTNHSIDETVAKVVAVVSNE